MDPELIEGPQLLVDHSVAGRHQQGQGHLALLDGLESALVTPSPRAILTSGQVQVEFLDTPGIVTQEAVDKFKLKPEVVKGEMMRIRANIFISQ